MFEHDYFDQQQDAPARGARIVGVMGWWILHLVKAAFLIYSGYHGISASWNYAANTDAARVAQIVGITVIEATMAGIYLAWLTNRITGPAQRIAAGSAYATGFILVCMGIVADSQVHAGIALSDTLAIYLRWGLPIAPAVMVVGAVLIHVFDPAQLRQSDQAQRQNDLAEMRFKGQMAALEAELEAAKVVANMQFNARMAVARQVADWYKSEPAQQAIRNTASALLPGILRAMGIDADFPLSAGDGSQPSPLASPMPPDPRPHRADISGDIPPGQHTPAHIAPAAPTPNGTARQGNA